MTPSKSTISFAVATTVADDAINVEYFVKYHLAIGAQKIFIFLDDNNLETYEKLRCIDGVKVFLHDENLRKNWNLIPISAHTIFEKDKDKEVMYRQCLNLGVASTYARHLGIDWLIHLDGDELFYPNDVDVDNFFKYLLQKKIGACRFVNYECIPTPEAESHHFISCQKFKVNNFTYFGHEQSQFCYKRAHIDLFQRVSWLKSKFFHFYANGKGATYLGEDFEIIGVHGTIPKRGIIYNAKKTEPLILHYACATFNQYKKKYRRLGNFIEYEFSDTMHLASKHIFSDADAARAKTFYNTYFALDASKVKFLEEQGLVTEINYPATVLESIDDAPPAAHGGGSAAVVRQRSTAAPNAMHDPLHISLSALNPKSALSLIFRSTGEARRWVRRNAGKGLFETHEIMEFGDGKYSISVDGKPALVATSEEEVKTLGESILSIMDNKDFVCISSGTESIYAFCFESLTRNEIEAFRYRAFGNLCRYLKSQRQNLFIALQMDNIDPLVIPLLDEGDLDYVHRLNMSVGFDHSDSLRAVSKACE